jgi:polar amino acid transport system substrate-binding protein
MRRLLLAAALLIAMPAQAQTLRIGHDAAFEPFAMVENGRATGLILDVVAEAMKRMKREFAFAVLTLDEADSALTEGKVDALAFKGDTPERRARMDFSAPIVLSGGALFARAGTPVSKSLKDFAGKTVVTPRRGPLFAQIAKAAPDVKLAASTSYAESFEMVIAGKADAAALNLQAGIRMARKSYPGQLALPSEPYIAVPLSFTVAKGKNAALLESFDATLAAMKADGSFGAIEEKWLGR